MYSHQGRFLLVLTALICSLIGNAQTVWYPRNSSDLLKSTAADLSANLSKAIPGGQFSVQEYQTLPATGIILIYDSSITANDACRIESNGSNVIKFSARQDNGLN